MRGICPAILLLLCVQGHTEERGAPLGRWSTGGTLIEVMPAGDSLSARIIALKHPLYRDKDRAGVVGTPRLDHRNPDPALRGRPLLGLELFRDFEFRNGFWQGRLYAPDSGRTFNARLSVRRGELHVRGFMLGMSWLGRSRSLAPIDACDEDIVEMLEKSGLSDTVCRHRGLRSVM